MALRLHLVTCAVGWLSFLLSVHAQSKFQTKCLSLTPEAYISNSTRQILEYVPAGTNVTIPYNDATCHRSSQVIMADMCRVALSIPTSNRSSITFELWLPAKWSGRILGTGNGGIDGCIKYEDLAYTTEHGFASFGANNGHNGTSGLAFFNNPDIVTDFAWRSLHTSVLAGKNLTEQFYTQRPSKSYYLGCSLGGRQGIKASEMFPTDFDGIIAGAPALDFNNLISWRASFFPITGPINSPNFITAATWTELIHKEILKQCDGLDGVVDGIIEDTDLCTFRPEALLCANDMVADTCLTPTQVEIVQRIFSPFYGEDSKLIYPAMQPGSEKLAVTGLYAGESFQYSLDWFRYVVYSDPTWNASTFTTHDALVAEAFNPSNIRTWPSSLAPFRATGGKIISYHGGQDNQITSYNTERFYNYLSRGMAVTATELDDFIRFFRVSGMFHCNSGPGAWVFGQGGAASAAGVPFERSSNVLAALVEWVEEGVAPETMEGTKFVNDTVELGVAFQRRHCRYPLRNTYIGGNYTLPGGWECRDLNGHRDPRGVWYNNDSRGYSTKQTQ